MVDDLGMEGLEMLHRGTLDFAAHSIKNSPGIQRESESLCDIVKLRYQEGV
jgi:hypothetical protein